MNGFHYIGQSDDFTAELVRGRAKLAARNGNVARATFHGEFHVKPSLLRRIWDWLVA